MVGSVSKAQVPHFAFPFRFSAGEALVVEQDTQQEIEQGVKVLVLTEVGERLEVPDFGIRDLTFQNDVDTEAIASAAVEWDDRVDLLFSEEPDRFRSMVRNLLIQVAGEE